MVTVKSKEEIAVLREGGRRHASIMQELAAMVKPGLKAEDLDKKAADLIRKGGDSAAFLNYKPYGASRPYPASLCVSINEEVVHGVPTEGGKVLKEGDIVSIDLGLVHGGLYTDMAVTVPVGAVSPEIERLLASTKEALAAGIKAAKGGRRVGDISNAIQRVGVASGFGIVEELCGHGVGYGVHEDPYVPNTGEAGKGPVLKPGMVIAIEPIFNLGGKRIRVDEKSDVYLTVDGSPSAHFEHTVLITKGGAEILTVL